MFQMHQGGVGLADAITPSGASPANYAIQYVIGLLSATPAPVTITAENIAKDSGQPDPVLTYAVTSGGIVAGDQPAAALARAPGESVGAYAIGQGSLGLSSDYSLTFNPGVFSVRAAGVAPPPISPPAAGARGGALDARPAERPAVGAGRHAYRFRAANHHHPCRR